MEAAKKAQHKFAKRVRVDLDKHRAQRIQYAEHFGTCITFVKTGSQARLLASRNDIPRRQMETERDYMCLWSGVPANVISTPSLL